MQRMSSKSSNKQEADPHVKEPALGFHGSRAGKDLVHGPGDHALIIWAAQHGVGLATASLAVGKDADLVAIQCTLDQLADLIKYFFLPEPRSWVQQVKLRHRESFKTCCMIVHKKR